ncbi:MAG: excinuclease ABC subunit UvrC, partial [Endomicrobiales bacterium]|nr:excinuclease ABC subunit UvrC [Endomicrobiales bacterium]
MNLKERIKNIPNKPGVYIMRDATAKIIYIGKAIRLRNRINSYFRNDGTSKNSAILSSLRHIDFILAASESEALVLENQLIKEYQPYYNVMWRDDKSYPYLKLTIKEDFPRLFLTRKKINDGNQYFGPYPQSGQISYLLKWLQKTFKWRPCRLDFQYVSLPRENKIKSCLYLQTDKCYAPCLGKITPKEYKRNLNGLSLFLRGRYKYLAKIWEKEMRQASKNLKFEKASELRNRIQALNQIHEKITIREITPGDLTLSLNTTKTLEELKNVLSLLNWPSIIEGFDISNISGYEPVGSMVRFHNGKPDKNNYRKFKIKTVQGINDTAMIKEVVYRRYNRLKNESKELPDLILIDGGKGQLSSASLSLNNLKLDIPIISLAKKEEEIFMPGKNKPLKLPKDSSALHLLQKIRDEAHRFA